MVKMMPDEFGKNRAEYLEAVWRDQFSISQSVQSVEPCTTVSLKNNLVNLVVWRKRTSVMQFKHTWYTSFSQVLRNARRIWWKSGRITDSCLQDSQQKKNRFNRLTDDGWPCMIGLLNIRQNEGKNLGLFWGKFCQTDGWRKPPWERRNCARRSRPGVFKISCNAMSKGVVGL